MDAIPTHVKYKVRTVKYKVRAVKYKVRNTFLTAKQYFSAPIHEELSAVYGPRVLSEGVVLELTLLRKPKNQWVGQFNLDAFNHPPYRPALVPRDYHLYISYEEMTGSHDELKAEVTWWLKAQERDFYADGIAKFVKRHDECLNVQEDYVEKQTKIVYFR